MTSRIIIILFVLLAGVPFALSRDDYTEVSAQELVEQPQKYWSQGVMFRDSLTGYPQGRAITIAKKSYLPLQTLQAGTCYAATEVAEELNRISLNEEYIFSGTVLHQPASFFSRSPSFYIVIHKATQLMGSLPQASQSMISKAGSVPDGRPSSELVARLQQELLLYAQRNNLSLQAVFSDLNPARKTAIQNILQAAIANVERQYSVTASSLLGEILYDAFVAEYAASSGRSAPIVPPSKPTPEPAVVAKPEASVTPVSVATPVPLPTPAVDKPRGVIQLKPGIKPSSMEPDEPVGH